MVVVGIEAIRRTSLAEEAPRIDGEANTPQADSDLVAADEQH